MICALRVSWVCHFVRMAGARRVVTYLEYGKPCAYSFSMASFRALWMGRAVSDSVGQKV